MDDRKLDFYIANNLNVLMVGKHGTGKTTQIIDAFERNKLKWRYFSAATMDPWVDFIGVPKSVKDVNGNEVLELVRPKEFANDEVEAIFFDEFSRSHKKIRNAVMELIQFKSINGKKFKNLRIIWAAINPEDDDTANYDVEKIDPAQEDRFHVKIEVPYYPSIKYFVKKFGTDQGKAAVEWWNKLAPVVKNTISPRRLDYALTIFNVNGDIRDVLPKQANCSELLKYIKCGSFKTNINNLFSSKDKDAAKEFLKDSDNFNIVKDIILKKQEMMMFFFPLIDAERLTALMVQNNKVLNFVLDNHNMFKDVLDNIVTTNQQKRICRRIKQFLSSISVVNVQNNKQYFSKNAYFHNVKGTTRLSHMLFSSVVHDTTTLKRTINYEVVKNNLLKDVDFTEAINITNCLTDIALHSRRHKILNDYSNLASMLQHLLNNVCEKTGKNSDEVFKIYNVFDTAYQRLNQLGIIVL